MNVFVLCTGRCGSVTFIKACSHIENYTASHESKPKSGIIGEDHFHYPQNHIEADNRLSWFLGRLEKVYGDNAFYVHLKRKELDTARSYLSRYNHGMIYAYRTAIVCASQPNLPEPDPLDVCKDYCQTVNANIETMLKDKSNKMVFSLENAKHDFEKFWKLIRAQGDLKSALAEWDIAYNKTKSKKKSFLVTHLYRKAKRVITKLPAFIKDA